MVKTFRAYIAYLKDNPEGYWFKRKAYGWGWTPATWQGWLISILFLALAIAIAWRAEYTGVSDENALTEVLLPLALIVIVLLSICYRTGEPPKWQWQIPRKYFKD